MKQMILVIAAALIVGCSSPSNDSDPIVTPVEQEVEQPQEDKEAIKAQLDSLIARLENLVKSLEEIPGIDTETLKQRIEVLKKQRAEYN